MAVMAVMAVMATHWVTEFRQKAFAVQVAGMGSMEEQRLISLI